jgi:hypothetical protein
METPDRVQMLEEASDLIATAIELIKEALKGTSEQSHANTYIIPHLNTWIGNGNPYDKSIDKYIESLWEENENEY